MPRASVTRRFCPPLTPRTLAVPMDKEKWRAASRVPAAGCTPEAGYLDGEEAEAFQDAADEVVHVLLAHVLGQLVLEQEVEGHSLPHREEAWVGAVPATPVRKELRHKMSAGVWAAVAHRATAGAPGMTSAWGM
eukprot:scaffold2059_cov342-Prasinococcus_capsulatus_cf.AAC.6